MNCSEDMRNFSFDERRTQVLKARIIQLERQNELLLESISQRAASFEDVDGILTSVANCCRKYIAKEGCPGREVNMERADLISCVTQLETARKKMYRQDNKMTDVSNLRATLLQDCLMSRDNTNAPMTQTNLFDASTGKLEHLNLKFVAKLESQLSSLLRELVQLQQSMNDQRTLTSGGIQKEIISEDFLVMGIKHHRIDQMNKCCRLLQESSENLMDLSMLHPSAPWGLLRRPLFQNGVTVEHVMASFPKAASNNSKIKATIETLMKAVNHKQWMLQLQIQALKTELKFHRDVYSLQISYTHSLMESLKEGYKKFHCSTAETLFVPLKNILSAFSHLKNKGDEESWTKFLATFKIHSDTLEKAIEWMSEKHLHTKEVLLDSYLSDFYSALAQLEQTNQNEKSESAQFRSDQLTKQQHLEELVNECLTLKDQKSCSENTPENTTCETFASSQNPASNLSLPKSNQTKNAAQLMSIEDPLAVQSQPQMTDGHQQMPTLKLNESKTKKRLQ